MESKISAVALTFNSQKHIERMLRNVFPCVDEFVVIDDGSTDDTKEIAAEWGCRVFVKPLKFHFGDKRNYGIQVAKHPWVLMVDDDEVFEELFFENVRRWLSNDKFLKQFQAVRFPRKNYIDGILQNAPGDEDWQFRLFRHYCRWIYSCHEELVGWKKFFSSPFSIIHDKEKREHEIDNAFYGVIEKIGIDVSGSIL